jgi:glucose-6-phosphate 1-dehydrogenase
MATTANPFSDPLRFERRVPECAIVIFGASGDLTKRKLLPALYRLAHDRRLPDGFVIIGTSRSAMSDEEFRERMCESVKQYSEDTEFDPALWERFVRNLYYVTGDMNDPALFTALAEKVAATGQRNVLFYLSTQPSYYRTAVDGLAHVGLHRAERGWRRIIVEKPFGHDLASAVSLNAHLQNVFPERETYRIDHYLGKETVQNIFGFRFGNGIFEPLWNRRYVNQVQITAAESIGVEGRGAYYQEAGALRDMIQNHLLQVMATIAMEPSAVFESDAVRDERAKLLRSIRIMRPEDVSRYAVAGQYKGFREEEGVDPQAQTDTYAAATFYVDNWRWAGVPFFIRSGKKLPKRVTDIAIQFKAAPLALFGDGGGEPTQRPNLLILRIQPEEGISLRFLSKEPGNGMRLRPVSMDFNYGTSFGERSPSAYETLLMDAMVGDATLYTRQDMVEASWRVIQPILDDWGNRKFIFPNYDPGTWGPAEADAMLGRLGLRWRSS